VLLGVAGEWWAPPAAVGALVVARLAAGRKATRGLAVLADVRRRAALTGLVTFIVCCGLLRIWVALSVVHLSASPAEVAVAFAMLGAFGLLPLGPSAPPGALLVVSGGAGALAAGLVLSATSITGVLVYAGLLALVAIGPRRGLRPCSSKARKRLKLGCSGPWKSAEPVRSRPRAAQCSATSRVCASVWVT
jgi:hypothetical protein